MKMLTILKIVLLLSLSKLSLAQENTLVIKNKSTKNKNQVNQKRILEEKFNLKKIYLQRDLFFSSGTVGNGGDSYIDEMNQWRILVINSLIDNHDYWQNELNLSEQEFTQMLIIFNNVYLYRHDLLDYLVDIDGKQIRYKQIFKKPIEEIFSGITTQEKSAINVRNESLLAIIFNLKAWNSPFNNPIKKQQLMAHELFSIVGLEKDGENHLSSQFGLDQMIQTPFISNDIPFIPLMSSDFTQTYFMGENTALNCHSSSSYEVFKKDLNHICEEALKNNNWGEFHSYECSFEGSIVQKVDKDYKITLVKKKLWLQGKQNYSSTTIRFSPFHHGNVKIKEVFADTNFDLKVQTLKTKIEPVFNSTCGLTGRVNLIGIDPNNGDMSEKILDSSQRRWDEGRGFELMNVLTTKDPVSLMSNLCFAARKTVRKTHFSKSYCNIFQDKQSRWQWELIGVHPFVTPFQY